MNLPLNRPEDTVARRIVMRRETWDQLVKLAEALEATRDLEVAPADVATIALEAGLEEVRQGLAGSAASQAAPRDERAPDKSGSGKRRRGGALEPDEQAEVKALVAGLHSTRSRQRTLALWLGLRRRRIGVDRLRQLAVAHDAYNVANFAQNMKKDGAYFAEVLDADGKRTGWKLTRAGGQLAREVLEAALAPA